MNYPTHQRVALVTGGSKGIGRAIAAELLESGTHVLITGRDPHALRAAVSDLSLPAHHGGARVEWVSGDVRREVDARAMVDAAAARLGGLDILINNAAVGIIVETASMTGEQWRETIETNLNGVFYCTHAAIPHLRQRGGGWIINISSLASANPFAGGAAYSATKAGLNAFGEALMQELRYDDIRVTTVCPGSVKTGFGGFDAGNTAEWKLQPEDVARVVTDLLAHPGRSLPSRVDIRPSRPPKKK
ncbi:MAG: SDR family oxidoreductase [Vicinamibacterales bacterium]|nr:SDR family oxidoreductase [Vicinamibacterales bacterium]